MSKNELALAVVEDLRQLADHLLAIATYQPQETKATAKAKEISIETVRAVLADKSQSGKQLEVKALITKHGARKLTDVDPAKYEELLKEAEML